MNYCELLFSIDEKYSDYEVLIDVENERRVTYSALKDEVCKVADFLKNKKGYKPGTVISTHLYNSAEAAIVLLAIQYIGGVACLIDPLFKAAEVEYYIADSDSKCLITHLQGEETIQSIESTADVINIKEIEEIIKQSSCTFDTCEAYHDYHKDEWAMLLYTSGSTSKPKGVMLSAGCFFTFLRKSDQSMYQYRPEDRLLCFVPFSHGYGAISLLIPALSGKAAIVFLRSFQPIKIANIIVSENITHIFGVPTHYQQLLRYESFYDIFRRLKAAFSAAAPLSYETSLSWYKHTGVYLDEGFGLTEATTLISTRMSQLPDTSGSIGYPPKGILSLEAVLEDGMVCEDGIIGELRVKGEGIMLGYLNRPEDTAERIRDGWLYTGDFGYRKSDGSFVICGRKTDVINVAGLKISPIEVEAALNAHSDVLDSAVIGAPDSTYGEVVKAFVILKNKVDIKERELIKYLSGKIANFKVPKSIIFLDDFPRNNLGKIDKKALKQL